MFTALATSDDGDSVAYAVGDRISIVSGRARAVRAQWQAAQDVTSIAFEQDAKSLTVSIGARGMVRLDAATGKPVANSAARGVVSPGGDLSVDLEKEGQELVAWNVESGAWERRLALRRSATNLHWSDDAEFVGYGGGRGTGPRGSFKVKAGVSSRVSLFRSATHPRHSASIPLPFACESAHRAISRVPPITRWLQFSKFITILRLSRCLPI